MLVVGTDHGRASAVLLPEPGLSRCWEAGSRESHSNHALWAGQVASNAPLLDLQGSVFRTEGNPAVRLSAPDRAGRLDLGPRGRGHRNTQDHSVDLCSPGYSDPLHPAGWGPGPPTPQRVGGFFPRRRRRCSSMRSGPLSARKRRTARPMRRHRVIVRTIRRSTRRAGCSSVWSSVSGRPSPPMSWCKISATVQVDG